MRSQLEKVTFDDIDDRGSFTRNLNFVLTGQWVHAAPCGMFHVKLHKDYIYLHCSNFSLDTATFTKPVDFKVELLPLVARNRKI